MKSVYSNNRKAPRMKKGQFSKMVITRELYAKFIETFPEYNSMTWEEFYQNWLDIAETTRYEAIYNPLGVRLGSHLGELKLQFLPYKFEANNYSASAEVGEKIPHLNLETKGKVPKIKWERRYAVKFNKVLQFYCFDETRELNKLAMKYVPDNLEKIRVARVTLGGHSIWRQKSKK